MPKVKEKMVDIRVTARFEVVFLHKVTEAQFEEMDKDELDVNDVIDESVGYGHLSSDGTCEMEWDYGPSAKQKKKTKK